MTPIHIAKVTPKKPILYNVISTYVIVFISICEGMAGGLVIGR